MSAFVDEAQLNVRGGDGGAGCVSFRREGPVVYGGPNGGDGGNGGAVWLIADRNVASLVAFRDHPHRRAEDGVSGMGKDLHGRRGRDLEVKVPEGTIVREMYSGEAGKPSLVVRGVVATLASCRIDVVPRNLPNRASMVRNAG
jgi:GTP-binding protein